MTVREGLIRAFQITAIVEAFTWTGLLIGMVFKYVVVHNAVAVRIFGSLHGIAMCAYLLAVLLLRPEVGWSARRTAAAIAVSVPPLATWPFERWAVRRIRDAEGAAVEHA